MGLLHGTTALVTGASRGIGRAIARRFAAEGAALVLAASAEARLDELAAELGPAVRLRLGYDVADRQAIQAAFQRIRKEVGQLDVAVNNAGVVADGMLGMAPAEQVQRVLAVNLAAVIEHLQFEARLMRQGGAIINLSSIVGRVGRAGMTVYSASKAGVIGATLSAAKELGPRGIRVNALAPGFIETDMTARLSPEQRTRTLAGVRLVRPGTPEDVAGAALFLASSLSAYVSGQILGVDGCMLE